MKKRFSIFIVSILVVAFVGCAVQPAADTGDLIYSYSDGAGNAYTLVDSILTYDPITPLESSSGEYSGGAPAQVTLSQANHNALTSLLDEAVADKSIQIENRVKFSPLSHNINLVNQTRAAKNY